MTDPLSRLGGAAARRLSRLGALARFGFAGLRASRQLNHFVEELSRRPYRLLTGVKPLPPSRDSTHTGDSAATGGGSRR